jgi:hypothetical protein
VNRDEQLQWEARWARPVAIAAFLAGGMLLVSSLLFIPKNREGIEPTADYLLSVDGQSGGFLASTILSALAALLLTGVFLYLFNTTLARRGGLPRWFLYLVVGAPVVFAIATVVNGLNAIDSADQFADGGVVRGQRGEDRATDIHGSSLGLAGLDSAARIALAFLFVMLPVRARRVGLLSPFMSILGVVAGALVVFPLGNVSSVVQAFWLGAVGMLFLGKWPGGRGPAWESGTAEPWPTAAQRSGRVPMPGKEEPAKLDPTPPEPEPVPERPTSRKRRRKR